MGYDPTGRFRSEIVEFVKTAVAEIGETMETMSPAFAGCASLSALDGPLLFGDILALAGATFLALGIVGYGISLAAQAPVITIPKEKEKTKAIAIPRDPPPIIFPINPNDFNPVGLLKVFRAGTKNGAFVSRMDPLTHTEVFRWDENPNYANGPHYHIYGTGHYIPGIDVVPEPYASIYFPLR